MRKPGLARLQTLIGNAKAAYLNDRGPNRADKLIPMLDEAFEIVLRLRSAPWEARQRRLAAERATVAAHFARKERTR